MKGTLEIERALREGFSVTRRGFLRGTLGVGAATVAGSLGFARLAHADLPLPAGRAFLFCYFPGGWDQLLLLDPRDPSPGAGFTEADRARTLIDLRYQDVDGLLGMRAQMVRRGALTFGPLASRQGQPVQLTDFADRMAIVRGVDMAALGHEPAYRYFLTATPPVGTSARGPSVATELVALMAPRVERPLANLCVEVESYNDRYPGFSTALQVRNAEDLHLVLAPTEGLEPDAVEAAISARQAAEGPCSDERYDRRGLLSSARAARSSADRLVRDRIARNFEFVSATTPEAIALRQRYNFAPGFANSPGARAALAVQALKLGLSQVVSVRIGDVTDTHFVGNAPHSRWIMPGLEAFIALLDDLRRSPHPEGGTFLDHTTVVGFSEFSRTPLFNSFGGRDHHPSGSLMLIGAGIRGGVVAGASSDSGMAPMPWDIPNNRAAPMGETIKPENIAATLLASVGVSSSRLTAQPIRAVLA